MKIKNTVSTFKQWTKPFLFFTLTTFACSVAYAEYYIVSPGPGFSCGGGCYVHRIKHCKHHHVKKHHVKKHKRIIVPCYRVPTCSYNCGCAAVYAPSPCSGCGYRQRYVYREPVAVNYYYADNYRYYDPDLATGDDYQSLHPGMNIDY